MQKVKMRRTTKIIIIIIILILILLLFVRLTGYIIRATGTSINTCVDSDQGIEYWTKGTVIGDYTFLRTESYHNEDKCNDEKTLNEYYCFNKGINSFKKSINFKCPEGCEDGKCLGEEIETPKGISILTQLKIFLRI